jgi:hypothetical protein
MGPVARRTARPVVDEAKVDGAHQLDRRGAMGEPEPVALDAAVRSLRLGPSHEPGDLPLDHRSLLTAGVVKRLRHREETGRCEQQVVQWKTITRPFFAFVQRWPFGQAVQFLPKRAGRLWLIVTVTSAGQVAVMLWWSISESSIE